MRAPTLEPQRLGITRTGLNASAAFRPHPGDTALPDEAHPTQGPGRLFRHLKRGLRTGRSARKTLTLMAGSTVRYEHGGTGQRPGSVVEMVDRIKGTCFGAGTATRALRQECGLGARAGRTTTRWKSTIHLFLCHLPWRLRVPCEASRRSRPSASQVPQSRSYHSHVLLEICEPKESCDASERQNHEECDFTDHHDCIALRALIRGRLRRERP